MFFNSSICLALEIVSEAIIHFNIAFEIPYHMGISLV